MNNETKKKAKPQSSGEAVQAKREQNPRQELAQGDHARRLQTLEYFEEIRILREYARDVLGMTKAEARKYAAANAS